MANIKKLTSVTVFSTGEGKRVSGTYSEITEAGDLVGNNKKFNFIALDPELLEHITAIELAAQKKLEGDHNGSN